MLSQSKENSVDIQLLKAIEENDSGAVSEALDEGANINTKFELMITEGSEVEIITPFMYAVILGNSQLVRILLKEGGEVNPTTYPRLINFVLQKISEASINHSKTLSILLSLGAPATLPLLKLPLDERKILIDEYCKYSDEINKIIRSEITEVLLKKVQKEQNTPCSILPLSTASSHNVLLDMVSEYATIPLQGLLNEDIKDTEHLEKIRLLQKYKNKSFMELKQIKVTLDQKLSQLFSFCNPNVLITRDRTIRILLPTDIIADEFVLWLVGHGVSALHVAQEKQSILQDDYGYVRITNIKNLNHVLTDEPIKELAGKIAARYQEERNKIVNSGAAKYAPIATSSKHENLNNSHDVLKSIQLCIDMEKKFQQKAEDQFTQPVIMNTNLQLASKEVDQEKDLLLKAADVLTKENLHKLRNSWILGNSQGVVPERKHENVSYHHVSEAPPKVFPIDDEISQKIASIRNLMNATFGSDENKNATFKIKEKISNLIYDLGVDLKSQKDKKSLNSIKSSPAYKVLIETENMLYAINSFENNSSLTSDVVCVAAAAFIVGCIPGAAIGLLLGPAGVINAGIGVGSTLAVTSGVGTYIGLRRTSLFKPPFEAQVKSVTDSAYQHFNKKPGFL
jgi:hypothetical protein